MGCASSKLDANRNAGVVHQQPPTSTTATTTAAKTAAKTQSSSPWGLHPQEIKEWKTRTNHDVTQRLKQFQNTQTSVYQQNDELMKKYNNSNNTHHSLPDRTTAWNQMGGLQLEPALASGAIALLDAQWLVNYAYNENNNNQPVLPRRQDLPDQAFVSLAQLQQTLTFGNGLPIICLSYTWLHPQHPDPKGTTLRLVARWCQHYLTLFPMWAIFWDYASLYQHPNEDAGQLRTAQQDFLFQQGLGYLSTFYAHEQTFCFQVTEKPPGFPMEYNLSDSYGKANQAPYQDRGWPFTESRWVNLVKAPNKVRDISRERSLTQLLSDASYKRQLLSDASHHREVPWAPQLVTQELQQKTFTNAKADQPLCSRLYKDAFEERFGGLVTMDYSKMNWGDQEISSLANHVLGAGYCPQLQIIDFSQNSFGAEGCQALARGLRKHARGSISLKQNPRIGDSGVRALASVLVQINKVDLSGCEVSIGGCQALVHAVRSINVSSPNSATLMSLTLDGNPGIGDDGMALVAELICELKHLTDVSLNACNVGAAGCKRLVVGIQTCLSTKSAVVALERLSLQSNLGIGNEGTQALADLLWILPSLGDLCLDGCGIGDDGCHAMAEAIRVCASLDVAIVEQTRTSEMTRHMSGLDSLIAVQANFAPGSAEYQELAQMLTQGKSRYKAAVDAPPPMEQKRRTLSLDRNLAISDHGKNALQSRAKKNAVSWCKFKISCSRL